MNTWDFSGAHFHQSAVGPEASVVNHNSALDIGVVVELRSLLRDLRARLDSAEVDQGAGPAREELDLIEDAIAQAPPDLAVVRTRWGRVKTLLSPALTVSADLAQVTSLINDLVSG